MPRRKAGEPRRQATSEEVRALSHPDRLRIIRLTFDASLTNKAIKRQILKEMLARTFRR